MPLWHYASACDDTVTVSSVWVRAVLTRLLGNNPKPTVQTLKKNDAVDIHQDGNDPITARHRHDREVLVYEGPL